MVVVVKSESAREAIKAVRPCLLQHSCEKQTVQQQPTTSHYIRHGLGIAFSPFLCCSDESNKKRAVVSLGELAGT